MKALIVDDEELALLHFNRMLERTNAFQSIITFQDPAEVLEHSELSAADAVFLDIEMPGINGIELAESIQEVNENIQVIFITAYNEFAIKAFELNAVDYLLKPVDNARLLTTVERIRMNKKLRTAEENTGTDYVIQCFGNLDFYQSVNGVKTYITVKWRTSKARELYAFLLLNQGRTVSKDMLMEMFWPAYDVSKASTQLYSTIYQIRKLIGQLPFSQSIENTDIGYILRLSGVKVDTVEWEKTLKEAPPLSAAALTRHMDIVMSYENHYLMENGYLWAEPEKARLAHLWLSKAYELIGFLIQEKNDHQAMDVCLQVEKIEPGDDKIIQYKLQLYNKLGKVEEAIKEYERYKQLKDKIN
ncbi:MULTISPECIES: response regulator [Bacillus]|uniref:response regulator n=1 Tax=Bacillus TaxID=1386 RepID=UPI0006CCF41A|nr:MULTISPECIES: response regulator [Bacillus]AMQ71667.1 transcriptional regulator [Bacillus amyloliquefaciens UMAF6639]AMR49507.1 transcriptional regulator [Bacillus amyloliquefaciens]ASP25394.1 DNA-binding response regulator [Bacillus velezensis]ATO10150.1 DNA-binding response regulator [Bacillus velezensis]AZI46058.1 response regulator [Bacillus velezensis]